MHWTSINPVLIEVFTSLIREPDATDWQARWKEQKEGAEFVNPIQQGSLQLKVTSCVDIGWDEQRKEWHEPNDGSGVKQANLYENSCGNRRFALEVTAEATEHTDEVWAMQMLERIRTRIWREGPSQRLLDVNVALIEMTPSQKATVTKGKRRISVGVATCMFAAAVNELDPVPIGWIERILLTSQVKNDAGVILPSPPNVIDDEIPPEP